jgi:hypothetical protein
MKEIITISDQLAASYGLSNQGFPNYVSYWQACHLNSEAKSRYDKEQFGGGYFTNSVVIWKLASWGKF